MARYSCVGKRYRYLIWNADGKNPFYRGRVLEYWQPLELEKCGRCANCCAAHMIFGAFAVPKRIWRIQCAPFIRCEVERQGSLVVFTIEGDGFLYNMVRIIVGTLLRVNEGKISLDQVRRALEERNRSLAGITAPACGLYLDEVFYMRPDRWGNG